MFKCENPDCSNEHDGSYGSGRFCSKKCVFEYIASINRGANNPLVKSHLDKVRKAGKISQRAKFGTWKCNICGKVLSTRRELKEHKALEHQVSIKLSSGKTKRYACSYCNKEYDMPQQMGGHISNCPKHPNKDKHDNSHRQSGKTMVERYKSGEIHGSFFGKHHTEKTKQKMRNATCEYLKNINPTPCRYNKKSIPILESIAKERGWHIKHAENGGEFYTGIGYWLDAYDEDLNIALEYDERKHYSDVNNNILTEKDLERQRNIIEHLHCEYWRYNEDTGVLWKVECI